MILIKSHQNIKDIKFTINLEKWKISKNIHKYTQLFIAQHFSQCYDLASHTTNVVCVDYICKCSDLQFNDNSK